MTSMELFAPETPNGTGIIKIMKYTQDEKVVDAVVAIIGFFCIIFGACMIGLVLAILKPILLYFGIENNL